MLKKLEVTDTFYKIKVNFIYLDHTTVLKSISLMFCAATLYKKTKSDFYVRIGEITCFLHLAPNHLWAGKNAILLPLNVPENLILLAIIKGLLTVSAIPFFYFQTRFQKSKMYVHKCTSLLPFKQ